MAPLEALAGRPTAREIADRCGTTRDNVQAWRRRGLSEWAADQVASALGWHPALVWPDWLDG